MSFLLYHTAPVLPAGFLSLGPSFAPRRAPRAEEAESTEAEKERQEEPGPGPALGRTLYFPEHLIHFGSSSP